ncbi:unnamed protein product [Lymnaea stagnalis]|uniref:FAST kinase leucine-rich domain-containing protein n=1 Tax=Lymnaea stagnalis TaxID=6523 RepID=A0AAV2IQ80_LYMST
MASLNKRILQKSNEAIKSFRTLKTLHSQDITPSSGSGIHCLPSRIFQKDILVGKSLKKFYTTDNNNSIKVLSLSSILVQDGINIEELPILIRRATQNSFPFTSYSYSGEKIRDESEFEDSFRQVLQNCISVNDVFKLLEVPSDKVRGYSAAFALQRLHVLKYLNTDWNLIHSFIRSAVMRELYDTVEKDVGLLSNRTLISLVECYLAAEGFSPKCLDAINIEVQIRLADSTFSIEELLTLANILQSGTENIAKQVPFITKPKTPTMSIVSENASRFLSNEDEDPEAVRMEHFDKFCAKLGPHFHEEIKSNCTSILKNLWIHLNSRLYSEINEETLPLILQALNHNNRNMVSFLEKPMTRVWLQLSPDSVQTCLNNLVRLRVNNTSIFTVLGRWAYVNIHKMTPHLLLSFLNTYIQFGFVDKNLFKVMEKCLQLKGQQVQTNVIAMCVEYCRTSRYVSPLVMDSAAHHFTQHGYSYEPLQLYAVLRAFGQLHYLPSQTTDFLKQVEHCLWHRFDQLDEVQLLEILGSFTFLNVLPKNFSQRVTSNDFFHKVDKLKYPNKIAAVMWLKVMKHAIIMSMNDDVPKTLRWLLGSKARGSMYLYQDSRKGAVHSMESALDMTFGSKFHHILPFYGCRVLYLDKNRVPLEVIRTKSGSVDIKDNVDKRLVFLLRCADHFSVNTKQLLGAQAQRLKHLQQLGFIPIEIRMSELHYAERISPFHLKEVLKQHLAHLVDFEAVAVVCADPKYQVPAVELGESISDWLGYDEQDMNIEDDGADLKLIAALLARQKGQEVKDSDLEPKTT